jgi:Undecaprenyl-phosphate galactose phosphotransferase WbaP
VSTKADEVISQAALGNLVRRSPPRPHLIHKDKKDEIMTFDGISSELTADSVSLTPEAALSPQPQWRPTPRPAARYAPPLAPYSAVKRTVDVLGALLISAAFSPLILVIVLMMSLDGGPILFRHRRIGRGGQAFGCLKFRTMVPNAEQILHDLLEKDPAARAEWVRDRKLRNDPRITRIGRFLRKTSLDELPQLWNVLRGEMALVGPRPIVKEEMLRYGRYLPTYLAAKPGVTGLWQVTGRNDTDYRRRVVLDTYYVRKQSLMMDLRILLKTIRVVLLGHGAY